MITIWDTSRALTAGIIECQAEEVDPNMPNMVRVGSHLSGHYLHGNDWHGSREAAVARAEQMRSAKLRSLEKQIAKLKAMRFE